MSNLQHAETICIAELENAQQCYQVDAAGEIWEHPTLGTVKLTAAEVKEGQHNQRQTQQTGLNFGGLKEIAEVKFMQQQHQAWLADNDPRRNGWEVPVMTWLFLIAAGIVGLLMMIPDNTGGVIA